MSRNDGELRQALFTQMVLYVDAGRTDMALQELEKQYTLSEKSKDAVQMAVDDQLKGTILLENGSCDNALNAYEKSAQIIAASGLSQELKDNAQLQLHYNRASVALGKMDLKKAKVETETFRKNLDTNSNLNQIWLGHELTGRIALAEKKYDLAIEELLQANQQNPYNLYRLATSYQVKGDKERAKEFCRKAAEFNGLPALNYAFIRVKAEKLLATLYTL
jgi:tetratricopeptide (TPR) repeat protein